MKFNPVLHGLRGMAALLVLLYHWIGNFPALANHHRSVSFLGTDWAPFFFIDYGWIGVHWFFVLSGYLLAATIWNRPLTRHDVVQFWQRRFMRIYPAVWVQLAISIVATYAFLGSFQFLEARQLVGNFLLWLAPLPGGVNMYNGVWWTLPVELLFYLLLPLLLLCQRRWGLWPIVVMALLVSLGWRAGVAQLHAGESLQRYAYLLKAFPGMLFLFVAGLSINHWAGSAHLAVRRALLLPAVAIYVALLWLLDANKAVLEKGGPLLVTWDLLAGLSIALVIAALIHPGKSVRWLGSTVLVRLGDWSYGIYLWHFPVLRWLPKLLPLPWNTVQGSAGALGLCLVITLLLAFASHEWVEKPALAWLARRQRAPRRTLSQTSQNPSLPPPQTP